MGNNYLKERIYYLEKCDNIPIVDSPLNTKAVSNYFLSLSNFNIDLMQLKNLLFFSYGYYLAIKGDILFNSYIEAWEYGPIIPVIHYEFVSEFGNDKINRFAIDYNGPLPFIPFIYDKNKTSFFNKIWEVFGGFTGIQLSNMTHGNDTPWNITWTKFNKKSIINNDLIKEYYLKQLRKKNAGS